MDNRRLESLDLGYEQQGQRHPLVKGKNMNKKNENFAVKTLECISGCGRSINLREILLRGCDIGRAGCRFIASSLENGSKLQRLDLS